MPMWMWRWGNANGHGCATGPTGSCSDLSVGFPDSSAYIYIYIVGMSEGVASSVFQRAAHLLPTGTNAGNTDSEVMAFPGLLVNEAFGYLSRGMWTALTGFVVTVINAFVLLLVRSY